MKPSPNYRSLATKLGIIATALIIKQTACADTLTWVGASTTSVNWSDSLNWLNSSSVNATPNNGDDLTFPNALLTTSTNDLASLTAKSVTLANGNFDFFGNALTVSTGITNSAGDNIFDIPLTLGASQNFEADAQSMTFDKAITGGANSLTIQGVGNVNLYGQVSGTGSLIMSGTGTLLVTNRQPLTGGIIVNSGIMQVSTPGNLNFGGAETPSLITVNTNGTIYGTTTHAIGGSVSMFINRGIWELDDEDYKQNITMWDGTIEPGPNPNSSGGELRVGGAGGGGTFTWYITNSITGSIINSPLNTIGSTVNLILDVARGSASSDLTINGVIRNSGNITVVHNGITTLGGLNTQSGTFTISGGTVVVLGNLWSSLITVTSNAILDISGTSFSLNTNSTLTGTGTVLGTLYDNNPGVTGAVLSPGGNNLAGTLTMGGLSLSGNGLTLNFDLANTTAIGGGTNDLIIATNFNANAGSTNLVNISFLNGTPVSGVPYTLIKYGNGFSGDPSQFLTATASRYSYLFTNNTTLGAIQVIVTGSPGNLTWKGDGITNSWDVNTSSNWLLSAAISPFLQGDNVTFNDNGSNIPPVTLVGSLQPTIITVNSTKDYTFAGSGALSGGTLLKSNSGNLTILTANINTGGGSLNGSGVVMVGNGGTTAANIGTGPLTNNTKVTFYENTSVTYGGNMSGTGSLVANMPGATLTLTGSNTFSGGLTALNGTTQIGNNTVASVAGTITNYSTLNLYRSDAFTNQNNITSAGNTLEYGNGDINVRGVNGMTVDGSGSINTSPQGTLSIGQSAYGKLTVNNGGLITLGGNLLLGNPSGTGNNGDVIQNGGTITVGNNLRIGHWASEVSTYTMNGGTLTVPNNDLAVGWDGIGLMTMNGGTVNSRTFVIDDNGTSAALNGTNSVFTMNNGTLNIGTGGITGNTATNAIYPTIVLSGGTIGTLAPAGWTSAMYLRLTNGSPTLDTSNATVTLSGILSGNGGLNKQGAGVLNLNGVNTYTNTTTVAAGTLQGTGTIAGPTVVQSGANLSAGAAFSAGTLTTSNLTMNTGANLVIDASSTATNCDLIYTKGTLTLDTATPIYFNFLGGTPNTNGAYTVVSNLLSRTGHLVVAPTGMTRYTAAVDESNPSAIRVSFSGTNANLVWQGNASTNWNINTDLNWLNAGVADKYYQSDVVLFDDTGISKSNVNLSANMTPASVTVDTAGNYTFSGSPISGITTLTKSGSGKLTLLNSNAYTGLTTIAGGTLQVGNGGTSGVIPNGTVNDYGTLAFNRSDLVTFSGAINGPGQLVQSGSGTLLVIATQNHYGGTTVNSGSTVQLGNGALADVGSLGNGIVTNNGTINFYRLSNVSVAAPYTGGGNFNFLGTGDSGQSGYVLNATNTFTGPVTLSYARIQSGAGAQSFGSPSSITVNPASAVYAVATPVSYLYNIPLTLSGSGWQDGLGALRMEGNGVWAGNITLAANSRIAATSATTNTVSGTISGNYELETYGNNAAGAILLSPSSANSYKALRVSIGTAGTKTIAGNNNAIPNNIPLIMNGGTLWLNGFNKTFSSFVNLSGSSSIQNGSTNSAATVTLTPVLGTSSYSGSFADGASQPLNVTFTQASGLWTLALPTASANWTGNLTNNGGTISSGTQNTPFGSQGVLGRSIVGNSNAVFLTTINNALAGYNGNVVLNNSTWLCNRYISMNPNAGYLYLANSTITGTNSSDGSYENWSLPSTVIIRGTAPSYLLGGGTSSAFDLQGGGTTFDVADVTGNANSDLIVGSASSTTFLHSPAATSSGGSMSKTGAGTMELDGPNSYTGNTLVNAGTLKLGASATLASASINIASGATFDVSALPSGLNLNPNQVVGGSGTVSGSLTDGSSTVIQPGGANTAGTLTITGNLTLNGAGSINADLSSSTGSGNDNLVVSGNLNLSTGTPTPVNFNFLNGAPAYGVPYTLIQCSGTISGTASTALTNAATSRFTTAFAQAGNLITVTFTGSSSNLVWTGGDPLTPSTWDVATSTNWFDGSVSNIFYQNDTVSFDDTTLNTNVNLVSTVTPASITVNTTNAYTIGGSGAIAGYMSLTMTNTGSLTLNAANTFSGPVTVQSGKLLVSGNSPLGANGNSITMSNGAALDFNGDSMNSVNTRGYSYTIAGSGPDGNGALLNSGGGIYSYANVSNLVLTADAVVGGNNGRWDIGTGATGPTVNGNGHNLTKIGSFQLDFRPQYITNLSSFTISNGNVYSDGYSFTNTVTAATTVNVLPGTSLGISGGLAWNMPLVVSNATVNNSSSSGTSYWLGNVSLGGTNVFGNGGAQIFSGVVSGPGGINIGGGSGTAGVIPAILTFSNANSFAGGVIISNAPVTSTNNTAVAGFAAVVVTSPNALGTGPITFGLTLQTTNAATNTARVLECNIKGGGALPNTIVFPPQTTLVTNISIQGHDSSSSFTLSGPIMGGFAGLTNWVDFGDSGSAGVIRLANNANSFLANIYGDRGVLAIIGDGCLGQTANSVKLDQASLNGGLRFDGTGISVTHNIIVNSTAAIDVFGDNNGDGIPDTANSVTIGSIVSGGGAFTVKTGTNNSPAVLGTLTLSGNNTFTGALTINPSTKVVAANANALGTTAGGTTVSSGGTLSLNLNGTYASEGLTLNGPGANGIGALENNTGANVLNGNISLASPTAIGVTSGSLTLGGVLSGTAPLTVIGSGVLTLNGANTYNAGTTVNGSTVLVNGSLAAGNYVNVASGAGLGGSGTINGPVMLQSGATFQPGPGGANVGKLTVNSTLNLGGNTVMYLNKSTPTNSQVAGVTTVIYNGTLSVTNLGGTLAPGDAFKLFSAQDYVGTFATLSLPTLGANLSWSNSLAANGTILVITNPPTVNLTPTNIVYSASNGVLTLSWPADHTGWRLLVQTNNLIKGVSINTNDWTTVPGSAATNQMYLPVDFTKPTEFYQLVYP